jgi:Ca-activated chloride channel family protein
MPAFAGGSSSGHRPLEGRPLLTTPVLAVAFSGFAALAAVGQEARPPAFPVKTEVVNVTVTVRDASGRVVSDLTAEDFTIYENGRAQTVQVFAPAIKPGHEETLALDLGLLLDTSGSMATEMKLTREAALRFLDAIPRARDLVTILFDQDIRISRYDSEHQQGLFERIVESRASGNTALYDSIAVYLSRVQDSPGRKVLLLLTDGEDSTSALSLMEVIQLVRSSPVTIYAIAFPGQYTLGSNRGLSARAFLRSLADLTGGDVFAPTASKDLPAIYEKILDDMSSQYVLGFVSDNPKRDGRYRKLKVEARQKGVKLRHRAGYYAPGSR